MQNSFASVFGSCTFSPRNSNKIRYITIYKLLSSQKQYAFASNIAVAKAVDAAIF